MNSLKNFVFFILLSAGSNSYGLGIPQPYYDLSFSETSFSEQTPFNFTSPIPERIRIMEKVNLSFYVNQSIVFQYRYRLEVPQGGGGSVNKSLLSWTPWINRDINEITVPKLDKEGRYKMVIEYRTHTSNDIRRYERPFEVYSIVPVNIASKTQSEKKSIQETTADKEKLAVTETKSTDIKEKNYQEESIKQDVTSKNRIKETEVTSIGKHEEESKVTQDIIFKRNGEEIKSKVLEITPDLIIYIDYSRADNIAREINISEVNMIIYKNGTSEIFSRPEEKTVYKPVTKTERTVSSSGDQKSVTQKPTKLNKQQIKQIRKEGNYFSIGLGGGTNYGGLGLELQYMTPGKMRLGIHGGAGYLPFGGDPSFLYSGGVKLYFWDYLYSDLQYGTFGVYGEVYINPFGSSFSEYSLMYGPSLLIGYDWYFSDHFGLNVAIGGSYDLNVYKDFTIAGGLGFIFRF